MGGWCKWMDVVVVVCFPVPELATLAQTEKAFDRHRARLHPNGPLFPMGRLVKCSGIYIRNWVPFREAASPSVCLSSVLTAGDTVKRKGDQRMNGGLIQPLAFILTQRTVLQHCGPQRCFIVVEREA